MALTFLVGSTQAKSWRTHAIVVGYNGAIDGSAQTPLLYADDDAVRNAALWRELGSDVELLAILDNDTTQRFPDVAPDGAPTLDHLRLAIDRVNASIIEERAAGHFSVVFFVYSGHGGILNDDGYLTLQNGPLQRTAFYDEVLRKLQADRIHVLIDACAASAMARSGDGSGTEEIEFARPIYRPERAQFSNTGFVLPDASPSKTYEWSRYRGGVFGYLVRSGLRGAADVDGDGRVSYRELDSFVSRAHSEIDSEYRPAMVSDPPADDDTLVYLSDARTPRTLVVDGHYGDHLFISDSHRRRYMDIRPGEQRFRLLLPSASADLFVVNVDKSLVYKIPDQALVSLKELEPTPYERAIARGPTEQFELLFKVSFDYPAHMAHQRQKVHVSDLTVTRDRNDSVAAAASLALGTTSAVLGAAAAGAWWYGGTAYQRANETHREAAERLSSRRHGRYARGSSVALAISSVVTGATAALFYWLTAPEDVEP